MPEKLTPWDAPIGKTAQRAVGVKYQPGSTWNTSSLDDLIRKANGGNAASPLQAANAALPKKPPTHWQRFKKFYEKKHIALYFGPAFMAVTQAAVLFTTPVGKSHVVPAFFLGASVAVLGSMFIHFEAKGFDDTMHDIELRHETTMARLRAEHDITQQYEAKYGPL